MAEEPNGVTATDKDPEQQVHELEGEIEQTRKRLNAPLAELDRRRHDVLPEHGNWGAVVFALFLLILAVIALFRPSSQNNI